MENQLSDLERKIDDLLASVDVNAEPELEEKSSNLGDGKEGLTKQ